MMLKKLVWRVARMTKFAAMRRGKCRKLEAKDPRKQGQGAPGCQNGSSAIRRVQNFERDGQGAKVLCARPDSVSMQRESTIRTPFFSFCKHGHLHEKPNKKSV